MANQIYVAPGATVATTVNQRLIYDSQSGKLFFDQDGSATAFAPTLIATLMGAPSISTNSFMVG
jgi:Ca2+-binding RTX toxin-like protein